LHLLSSSGCSRARILSFVLSLNTTSPPALYTLSLHDALPIFDRAGHRPGAVLAEGDRQDPAAADQANRRLEPDDAVDRGGAEDRSEEHTSELQSRENLVCRLLLEKKKE